MARRPNGVTLTAEQLKMMVAAPDDEEMLRVQLRNAVRECFDEALHDTHDFEDALVMVYSAGMQRAMNVKIPKKRGRKPKVEQPAAE